MQEKIAMMLILMMMSGLDAHGARDLHPGLRKNSSQSKMVYTRNSNHFDLLIYMLCYLVLSVLDKHWTLRRGPQGFYYSPWRDSYPASPAITRTFKDTNTKQRPYLDNHYELEDDLSLIPNDSNNSGNALRGRRFCVFSNKPGCIHLRIY